MTVIEEFAAFAAGIDPPGQARAAAKTCILDWYGGAIAGSVEMPATGLRRAFSSPGPARLLPDDAPSDPRTAALINGTASHTVEVDDIYCSGLYHPGVVTIPAALAVGELCGISGADLIRSVVAGYEVGNRIARAVNPAHYRYWHTTATVGHFGAAVAASVALGLSARQIAHAMATVATCAAGLRHAFSSDAMSKPLHAGRAAEAGVMAALAAREGVTGVADILEGERGFGAVLSEAVNWNETTNTLGDEWTITQMTQKAHACCGHNFAVIDAIKVLMDQHNIVAEEIVSIDVGTYRAAVEICGNPMPSTAAEARFSLPWCAAVIALTASVTPAAFTNEALADETTRALAAMVNVSMDEEAETAFPHSRSAFVTLHLKDRASVNHRRPTRKGDPDDPLTQEEIEFKFQALAEPVLGAPRTRALLAVLQQLDQIDNINHGVSCSALLAAQ